MKKIAFILQDLTGGGAERTVSNLSFELSKYYDFYIIVFNGKNISYPHNAKIIDINCPAKKSMLGKIFNVFKRAYILKKIKKEYKFDIVIGFMFSACIVNILSRTTEKIISSVRNYMSAYGMSRLLYLQEHFIAEKADLVVAISEMVRNDLIKNFRVTPNKIVTIYNPCDTDRLIEYSKRNIDYYFDPNQFYFISVGRLVRQKGQWDLIKAMSIFSKKYSNAKLLILGTGCFEKELKKLSKDLGINKNVEFLGFQNNPYVFLAKSNVFILTSLHEGLGNVILEAMACGIPVISTDCYAGPREILSPDSDCTKKASCVEYQEYGVIVPEISRKEDFNISINNEHKMLSEAMEKLYLDSNLREKYTRKAINRLNDFSQSNISNKWHELFEMLLED